MKIVPPTPGAKPATLKDVVERLGGDGNRRRDMRSAVTSYAKLVGRPPSEILLDLASIRETLDGMSPSQAGISAKRWANLRSDLAAAIDASGLVPMLRTKDLELDVAWRQLLDPIKDERVRLGLSRFARWASLRKIAPQQVCDAIMENFVKELETATLIRKMKDQHRAVATAWNRLVALQGDCGLVPVELPSNRAAPTRFPWEGLPASFREDVERHLTWASVPDPLDEGARARALAPRTRHLRLNHLHSAVTAAFATGMDPESLTSLASLLALDTFKAILKQLWKDDRSKLSAYTHGIASTLIAIATEWVKAPADTVAALKALRRKLGTLRPGLTEKNKALLRKFDDPDLLHRLVGLPDKLWHRARRELAKSRRPFVDLQSALAIDILIHVPLRMENLAALHFDQHLHWPQGRGKSALLVFEADETKNDVPLEFEVPAALADRLNAYRNEIAPAVTGARPDAVFVTWKGKPRGQGAITVAIEKAVFKHLGVKLTPHQFRHIVAKIILDANPGAIELVRQMMGHKNLKTATNYYAGIDTRRAGRAHANLLVGLREEEFRRRARRKPPRKD